MLIHNCAASHPTACFDGRSAHGLAAFNLVFVLMKLLRSVYLAFERGLLVSEHAMS
jgi:hypothetical protein